MVCQVSTLENRKKYPCYFASNRKADNSPRLSKWDMLLSFWQTFFSEDLEFCVQSLGSDGISVDYTVLMRMHWSSLRNFIDQCNFPFCHLNVCNCRAKYNALLSVTWFSWRNTELKGSMFSHFKIILRGNDKEFMVSIIPEEHLKQQLISKQFPHCSSSQLLWEIMLTANLLNTFGSRWATSHTLFDEHAFLQSGKTICRRMLSFCILLVFEMSPSSASLPQTLVLRLLLTAIRRQLKVNCLVAATLSDRSSGAG